MRLVNPQPMETLPETGRVWIEVTQARSGQRYVIKGPLDVQTVQLYYLGNSLYSAVHAWSHAITVEELL